VTFLIIVTAIIIIIIPRNSIQQCKNRHAMLAATAAMTHRDFTQGHSSTLQAFSNSILQVNPTGDLSKRGLGTPLKRPYSLES